MIKRQQTMCSATMILMLVLAPTVAQQLPKPALASRSQFQLPGFRLQTPLVARGNQPQRLPPANGQFAEYSPQYSPEYAAGGSSKKSSYGSSSYGSRASSSYQAQLQSRAPDPPSSRSWGGGGSSFGGGGGSVEGTGGLTPDQIEFMKRKGGQAGFGGGLDTHGRPSPSGGGAPAPAPAYSGGGVEGAGGLTPDQIEFMNRKSGKSGFENVLDTHGRASPTAGGGGGGPAPAPSNYQPWSARESPNDANVFGILAAGLFICSGVTFAILRLRRSSSDLFGQPLLGVSA